MAWTDESYYCIGKTKRQLFFHNSLESGFGLNIFPKETTMFRDSEMERAAVSNRLLAKKLGFSPALQLAAAAGAVCCSNPSGTLLTGEPAENFPLLPNYSVDRLYLTLRGDWLEEWKKLWCAAHRNRAEVERGKWNVQAGLLRRYLVLEDILSGLSALDLIHGVIRVVNYPVMDYADWVSGQERRAIKSAEKQAEKKRDKFEDLFWPGPRSGRSGSVIVFERFERCRVFTERQDRTLKPGLIEWSKED